MARLSPNRARLSAVQSLPTVVRRTTAPPTILPAEPTWQMWLHSAPDSPEFDAYTWLEIGGQYRSVKIPLGEGGGTQIIRSAIAPSPSPTKPTWEEWIQETPRAIRQFTHANVGGVYHPIPIPWCCSPVREYDLLKPNGIEHKTTPPPPSSDSVPAWQIWTEETEAELRRYTWAKIGERYVTMPIPWASRAQENGLGPELLLRKPSSGILDPSTSTSDAQYIRSDAPPPSTPSPIRPTWEFWIHESADRLTQYAIAKVAEGYVPIPLPWVSTVRESAIVDEFELQKSASSGDEGALNLEIIGEVHRSSTAPSDSSSLKPGWQVWIRETALALYWFAWAHVGNEYKTIPLPWYSSSQGDQIVNHFELLKPTSP